MKKKAFYLLTLLIIGFWVFPAIGLLSNFQTPFFNVSKPNREFCANPNSVCLDNIPLFQIHENFDTLSPAMRASQVRQRLIKVARNYAISTNSLKVEKWKGTVNITSPDNVILTFRKEDLLAIGVPYEDGEKIAEQYLDRINYAINQYRTKWLITRLWLPIFLFLMLLLIAITYLSYGSFQKKWKLLLKPTFVKKFTLKFFALGLEWITSLIFVILLGRLILVVFNINVEAAFFNNIFSGDLSIIFTNLVEQLQIVALLLLLSAAFLVVRWLSRQGAGTIILPFENSSSGALGADIGKAIADSLVEELNRIRYIPDISQGKVNRGQKPARMQ
jgi:hypothetical protein